MACLFTKSGTAARKFRYEAQAGNIGINVGVAAPMAFFPFCGWKESFYGDLHGQGRDAIDFYTEQEGEIGFVDLVQSLASYNFNINEFYKVKSAIISSQASTDEIQASKELHNRTNSRKYY